MILIFCVLFAALTYAVTQSMRQTTAGVDREKISLSVTEILQFGNSIDSAVKVLLMNGCGDTKISFDDHNKTSIQTVSGTSLVYTNSNSPADKSCHVFNVNGGGISPRMLSADAAIDASAVPAYDPHPQSWTVYATKILGDGTDAGAAGDDVVLFVGRLKKEVCIAINNKLGITNPSGNPPVDTWSGSLFVGTYGTVSNPIGDETTALQGKKAFCATDSTGNFYSYIQVLIAR